MMQRLLPFWIVLMGLAGPVLAQGPHPILTEFALIRQYEGILLKWTIKGGSRCEGTRIFRAEGDGPFALIGSIEGICGGTDFNETYTYHDTLPASNRENHYRLEMGDLGFTETVTLFYDDFGPSGHARLTDPHTGTVTLLVSNARNVQLTVQLVDMNGRVAVQQQTVSNALVLDTAHLPRGVYVYRISGEGVNPVTGRLAVGHP
jgi:hypothetical protein